MALRTMRFRTMHSASRSAACGRQPRRCRSACQGRDGAGPDQATRSSRRTNSSSAWVTPRRLSSRWPLTSCRSSTRRTSPRTAPSSTSAGNTRSCPAARIDSSSGPACSRARRGGLTVPAPAPKTATTGTFGGGVVIGQKLQVDLAVLTRKELVVSAGYRF